MGKLRIGAVYSESSELESRIIAIDDFENISRGYNYEYGVEVYHSRFEWNEIRCSRGEISPNFVLIKNLSSCNDDIVIRPNIDMYLALSQALMKKRYVFNKKKGKVIHKGAIKN